MTKALKLLPAQAKILEPFKDKAVIFIGLGQGRSARGVKQFLKDYGQIKSFEGVNQKPGDEPWEFLKDYDSKTHVFIKNEGVPGPLVPVKYTLPMQLFFELVKPTGANTIGITGTKGKSTATSLTAAMLEKSFAGTDKKVFLCGNIGTSVFTFLEHADKNTTFVVELSSYQLSDMTISPHISVCINLYFDHVDWHGSKEAYWESKHNIMRFAGPKDHFVYNPAFPALLAWAKAAKCQTETISDSELINIKGSHLLGEHNRLNAIAASLAAKLAGANKQGIEEAIKTFEPLPHRLQIVADKLGVTYIDDGIATTPEATLAALKTVNEEVGPVGCLILGGEDRGYDFRELLYTIAKMDISNLVLYPDSGERIRRELPTGYKPNILVTRSMKETIKFAHGNTVSGEVVLLSNASPSYSIWPNGFEQKGEEFAQEVAKL